MIVGWPGGNVSDASSRYCGRPGSDSRRFVPGCCQCRQSAMVLYVMEDTLAGSAFGTLCRTDDRRSAGNPVDLARDGHHARLQPQCFTDSKVPVGDRQAGLV